MSNGNAPKEPVDFTEEDAQKVGSVEQVEQEAVERQEQTTVRDDTISATLVDPREPTRAQLARGLILILAATIAGVFVFVGFGSQQAELITQIVLPAVVGLVGTALGFYFGSQSPSGGR